MMYTKKFPVKYKRTVYEDAHVEEDGHIWFNNDTLEFVPKHNMYREDTVIEHSFVTRSGKQIPVSKVSRSSIIIMKNRELIYESLNIQF